jgi:hypothetical protein
MIGDFMDFLKEELGNKVLSSSSIDIEGSKIAKALDARYLGFKHDFYWFNDNRTDSSYIAKDLQSALQKRNDLWKNFGIHPQNN